MNLLIFFVLLILLCGTAYAVKGNIDIMKKDIIDECEELDEFGNCVTKKEATPVVEKTAKTFSKVGVSIANSLGLDAGVFTFLFVVVVVVIVLIILGIVFFKGGG